MPQGTQMRDWGRVMNMRIARRVGLAMLVGLSVVGLGAQTASADHWHRGHTAYGRYGCPTPVYSYRPIVVPGYGYGYSGIGFGYPGVTSYRAVTTYPFGGYGVGGFPPGVSWGVGGFPPGASWGGGGFPPGASWGGSGRGFSLYIGR
jgi:hypothetical protein